MKLVLLLVCGGAFVLFGACCGGNGWRTSNLETSTGLWKDCNAIGCNDIGNNVPDKFKAIRAFAVLAVLASAGAGLLALFGLCVDRIKGASASVLLISATICMIISLAIYTDEYKDKVGDFVFVKTSWGWSWYLGWVGCVVAIVGAILGVKA